jgi:hypothetical protein
VSSSSRRRSLIALSALAVLVVVGTAGAASSAAVPTPPGFPPIGPIPGSKTAKFKVVVEGEATAVKEEDWSSLTPCVVSIHARIEETTTYRRGRGVLMEFVTLGPGRRAPIILQRVGRRFDASLALVVTTTRTAEGSASRQNPPEGGVCDPRTEDLSQGPDCGKPDVSTRNSRLLYDSARGLLSLQLRGLAPVLELECPHTEIRGGIPSLKFGWPSAPKLPQFNLPRRVIFGKAKVIVRSESVGPVKKGPETAAIGALTGTLSDFGNNKATIRLIRVG